MKASLQLASVPTEQWSPSNYQEGVRARALCLETTLLLRLQGMPQLEAALSP